MDQQKQIKSKKRVADHGEVFTSDREVNNMLDLLKQETERIDSRFLEPACGSGNFLMEILKRKIEVVSKNYKKSQLEFERYLFVAASSLYGVDILQDNVRECQKRLYQKIEKVYRQLYKKKCKDTYLIVIEYILSKNIICGDALTMLNFEGQSIIFSEWSLVQGNMVKRRDYTLSQLLAEKKGTKENFKADNDKEVYIPKPIKEFPMIDYRRLLEYE